MAEFLFSEDLGLSGYAGYTYQSNKAFAFDSHDNAWHVGMRWYTGGGALIDRHRNGNLNPWLPGVGTNVSVLGLEHPRVVDARVFVSSPSLSRSDRAQGVELTFRFGDRRSRSSLPVAPR